MYQARGKQVIGCSLLLVDNQSKTVLLTNRQDVPVWVFPGVKKELNETPKQCVVREIREEIGIKVTKPKLFCRILLNQNRLKYFYFANFSNQHVSLDKKEVAEYKWVGIDSNSKYINHYNKHILKNFIKHQSTKEIVEAKHKINIRKELVSVLKANPYNFIKLIYRYTPNQLTTRTFKIN